MVCLLLAAGQIQITLLLEVRAVWLSIEAKHRNVKTVSSTLGMSFLGIFLNVTIALVLSIVTNCVAR